MRPGSRDRRILEHHRRVPPKRSPPRPPWRPATTTTEFTLQGEAKTQVDELTAQANAVQAELDALNVELEIKTEEYNKCLDDLDTANARMSELRRTVADAQADKARQQAQLNKRLKAVYMSGGRDQLLQLLLLADGLDDLYNRVRLVSTLADQDTRLVSDLEEQRVAPRPPPQGGGRPEARATPAQAAADRHGQRDPGQDRPA